MKEFLEAVNIFVVGLAIGYCWHPIWNILKKIYVEAKKAKEQW